MSIRIPAAVYRTLSVRTKPVARTVSCPPQEHHWPKFSSTMAAPAVNGTSTEAPGTSTEAQAPAPPQTQTYKPRYIDIGINLADPIFRGRYHGTQRHPDDLQGVVSRAREVGCTKLIVTGSSFRSSRDALKLAAEFPGTVFATAGIHPCTSAIFGASHTRHHDEVTDDEEHTPACDPDPSKPIPDGDAIDPSKSAAIMSDLEELVRSARASVSDGSAPALVAFGEFGLDYDRLHYCSRDLQRHSFAAQLRLAAALSPQLPLFLHSRAAHADFVAHLKEAFGDRLERLEKGGVVHSFTGTVEEMRELMDLGLYIGVNGCSFKTAENCAVVKEIELSRLMIETDGPWCEVRPSHEGWKYLIEPKPAPSPAEATGAASEAVGNAAAAEAPPKKQGKKNQKKEPEVPDRFKVVKKEKWEEGAMVKGRNEPCTIERIAKIVAGIKGISVDEVCEVAWANTVKVFDVDS